MRTRTVVVAGLALAGASAAAVTFLAPVFVWPDRIWVPAVGISDEDWDDARIEPAGERVHVTFCLGFDDSAFLRREDTWWRSLVRKRRRGDVDWEVLYDESGHVERDGRTWTEFTRRPDSGR